MKPLDLVDLLMKKLGYVRLKAHGYALTPEGRIVEVRTVDDDRFEPPPMSVVPFQSPVAMLPPAPKASLPTPRPLPPPPAETQADAAPEPLFTITEALEPEAPAAAVEDAPGADEEIDEEEWEWKMAMARARAIAGDLTAAPAPIPVGNESTRPPQRPGVIASRPTSPAETPRRAARPAVRPALPADPTPPARASRLAPRASDPPQRFVSPVATRTPARAGLEKSVARVFPAQEPKRPLPERPAQARIARGTTPPQRAVAAPHTVARAAEPAARPSPRKRPVGEDTATDITATDRAWQSMQSEEQTRVNIVSAPVIAAHLDDSIDEHTTVEVTEELDSTRVDPVVAAAVKSDAPLPRLSARLKRPSA